MSDVLSVVDHGCGRVRLNRPNAINALTTDMCLELTQILKRWVQDPSVERVVLDGAGERGFCAGADVRALRTMVLDDPNSARRFFEIEYALNSLIANYPKPIEAAMSGITMGGGVGLSVHASKRVTNATSVIAMPEVTIGLFPDVGALYELSRAPGETGAYLAMTGASIDGASAVWAGLADVCDGNPDVCALEGEREWIDECFFGEDAVAIRQRLAAHSSPKARAAADLIEEKCPLSVWVSLIALRRAAECETIDDVLAQDLKLANKFIDDSDFCEGVRAQLVDKDRKPRWRHGSLREVSPHDVLAFFD